MKFSLGKSATWAVVSLVVIAAVSGGLAYRQYKRFQHFTAHDQGMVYRSAWLSGPAFAELIEKHQIRTIINLCNPDEMGHERCLDQRASVAGAGAKLLEMPMPATVDANAPEVQQFVDVFANPNNYPILVHCQHGVTRTAKVLAIYDVLFRHIPAEQSIKNMPLFGRDDYNVSVYAFAKSIETVGPKRFGNVASSLDVLRR